MAQTKVSLIKDGVIVVGHLHTNHGITTGHIGEGSNLYFTDARVMTSLGSVSTHIIPDTDITYDLGSPTNRFRDLYLSGNTIYIGDTTTIGVNASNEVEIKDTQGNLKRLVVSEIDFVDSVGRSKRFKIDSTSGRLATFDSAGTLTADKIDLSANSTTDLAEGSNLYYTDARVGTYLTTNSYATQVYVNQKISDLIASAPSTLDTLNELAAALGDDPNFATTVSGQIGTKWTQDNAKITNWDTAYGWGNHASVGYLTTVGWNDVTGKPSTFTPSAHNHDDRYYTETESDARFLGIGAKAADSNLLDGIDSSQFLRSDVDDTISGKPTFAKSSSGTLASRTGYSDFIGYNPSYGSYIGGKANNSSGYIYAGGYYSDGSTVHTLIHSGNIGSQSVNYANSAGNADTLDGNHGTYFDQRRYTDANNYLGGHYTSGGNEKPNSSTFGAGKLKVAMLGSGNLGFGGSWNDVLWMSTYTGGDVKRSTALVSSKYDDTSLWIVKQNFDSATWGTGYLFWNSGNFDPNSKADASHNHDGTYVKEGGTSFSGEYPVVVRTSADVVYSDANIRFRGSDSRLTVDGSIETPRVKVTGSYDGNFGYASFSWGGSSGYPTLFSDHADRWVMHVKPHIVWTQNGERGYTGNTEGSMIRFEGNLGSTVSWDAGCLTDISSGGDHWGVTRDGGWVFYADPSANFHANSSMRAPVFYDSNNTSYYTDPSSTSRSGLLRSCLTFNDYGAGVTGTYTSTRLQTIFNMGESYKIALDGASASGAYGLYWSHQNAGSLGGANNLASHGILIIENGSWKGAWGGGSLRTPGDARAPIFYDYNDTNLYVDPSSTSVLNYVTATEYKFRSSTNNARFNGVSDWGTRLYTDSGYIQFGPANSGHAHIYTDRSNFYFNRQLQVNGGSLINTDDVRSQTFYDVGDTGFYMNPAGDNRMHTIISNYFERINHHVGHFVGSYNNIGENSTYTNPIYTIGSSYNPAVSTLSNMYGIGYSHNNASFINMTGASGWGMYVAADGDARVYLDGSNGRVSATGASYIPIYYDYSNTGYYVDPASTSNLNSVTASTLYGNDIYTTGGWFRNHTNNNGIYWNSTGWHLYPENGNDFYIRSGSSSEVTLHFIRQDGTSWGYIHNDSNRNIGFLNYNRGWVSYTDVNGNHFATASSRAPIFYDSNNTGYYVDPSSTSNINALTAAGTITAPFIDINKTSTYGPGMDLTFSGAQSTGILIRNNTNTTTQAISFFYSSAPQGARGSITVSSTSTAYNTSSDYRLKENLVEITDGIERVKLLQPKRFNFIGDDKTVDGFVAHEAQEVVPESVTGVKDGVDYEGNPEYQGIDQAKLVPLLTAALQEAIAKIESLEARIQVLENQ